jgi:hypothetical protein
MSIMHDMQLSAVDLNLARAAKRLGLSQSATSHALARQRLLEAARGLGRAVRAEGRAAARGSAKPKLAGAMIAP